MFSLRVFSWAALAGAVIAAPLVWATWSGSAAAPAVAAHVQAPSLPEGLFGAWVDAGVSSDPMGRPLHHGFRWLPKGELRAAAFEVAQRWRDRSLRPTYQNTEDGGLFLSAVDLASGRQESYLLQPGAGGLSVWVTVAGLELGADQGVRGPATGGQGEATERWVDRPLKPAAQANASALLKQGWSMQPLSDELREQMESNGALVRYWVRGDRTLQELVHEREGRTQLKMTTLPRQSELQP